MYVVFWFPLLLSIIGAVMFAIGDYGLFTKGFFVLLAVAAAVLQFVPFLQAHVHFVVPLLMQLFVAGCWGIASKFE